MNGGKFVVGVIIIRFGCLTLSSEGSESVFELKMGEERSELALGGRP